MLKKEKDEITGLANAMKQGLKTKDINEYEIFKTLDNHKSKRGCYDKNKKR